MILASIVPVLILGALVVIVFAPLVAVILVIVNALDQVIGGNRPLIDRPMVGVLEPKEEQGEE